MKYSSTTTRALALLSLLQVAQSTFLRSGSSCPNVTTSTETTRCLQETPVPYQESVLNELIKLALPSINNLIAENVPDPLSIDLDGALALGSVDIGCDNPVSSGFTYNLGGITGLSEIFIETLEVVSGTEDIVGCFLNQDWSGTFNIAIASLSTLSVDDLGAGFQASGCGLNFSPNVGGTILTENPTLAGTVEMAGQICAGGYLTIDYAKIIDSLAVGYSAIDVQLANVPSIFSGVASQVVTPLVTAFEPVLTEQMEPDVRPVIEASLVGESTFAPAKIIPIQAALAKHNMQSAFQSMFGSGDGGN